MRFGILSTAEIARTALIPAIRKSEHTVGAIASRDGDRARTVAERHDIPEAYDSYEALLDASTVDAVYNPLPNSLHAEWSKRVADHGLDVLCEKPLTVDAEEARELRDYCRERDVTLMEAFMYRYHPRTERALELARRELDGVHWVSSTFKFPLVGADDIRLRADLAGGSLMDVGCYPVSLARVVLGTPDGVLARSVDARDCGVDTRLTGVLTYDSGALAQVACSFDTADVQRYRIEGENGWIEAEPEAAFTPGPDRETTLEYSIDGRHGVEEFQAVDQYRLQVDHFAACAEEGTTPRTGPGDAIENMRVIDALYESAAGGEEAELE